MKTGKESDYTDHLLMMLKVMAILEVEIMETDVDTDDVEIGNDTTKRRAGLSGDDIHDARNRLGRIPVILPTKLCFPIYTPAHRI